jgi:hypothetical protein
MFETIDFDICEAPIVSTTPVNKQLNNGSGSPLIEIANSKEIDNNDSSSRKHTDNLSRQSYNKNSIINSISNGDTDDNSGMLEAIDFDICEAPIVSTAHVNKQLNNGSESTVIENANSKEILLLLQKKVVRILSNASYDAHTSPLFKSKMILKFEDIYLLNLGKFMFSYQNNLLPPSFSNFFSTTDQIHSHNLRTAGQFYVPFCRTKAKQFTVKYQGPKFFNSLNSEIRDSPSISTFQLKLNKYLVSLYS